VDLRKQLSARLSPSKRWCATAKQRDGEVDCDYWKRTRNGVKKRLIESYRNGQKSKFV
jgi:hypothetical protein